LVRGHGYSILLLSCAGRSVRRPRMGRAITGGRDTRRFTLVVDHNHIHVGTNEWSNRPTSSSRADKDCSNGRVIAAAVEMVGGHDKPLPDAFSIFFFSFFSSSFLRNRNCRRTMLLPFNAKYKDFDSIYIRTFWENKSKSSTIVNTAWSVWSSLLTMVGLARAPSTTNSTSKRSRTFVRTRTFCSPVFMPRLPRPCHSVHKTSGTIDFCHVLPKRKAALGHFDTCCRRIRAVHSIPAIVGDRRPMGFRNGFFAIGIR
jgi:hypothetical protein